MDIFNLGSEYVMNTYNRFPIVLEKGDGMYVEDENGKKYLDFVAGIAVNSLGSNHEKLCKAIAGQAQKIIHVSNLYWTKPQVELAKKLVENSCFSKVFFCNSGAESIEAALKLARKYAVKKGYDRYEYIAMENSFHGRTFGAVSVTGQMKYQKGLNPILPGIHYAEFNNFESVKNAVTDKTCAIILEPLQGEGGIHPAEKEFLKSIRVLCDEKDICLIFDEVQCGVGRLGTLFAYQYFGVEPDMATFAKGLAGGVPIGALMATDKVAIGFEPGDHASTFGGNPLAAAAANVVIDELLGNNLLENAAVQGKYLTKALKQLQEKNSLVVDMRGIGLMQGIELSVSPGLIIKECIEKGLLLVNSGADVIRFVPPLIVTSEDIDKCISILSSVLESQ